MTRTQVAKYLLNKNYLIYDTYNISLDLISFDNHINVCLHEEYMLIKVNHEELLETELSIDYSNLDIEKLTQLLELLY